MTSTDNRQTVSLIAAVGRNNEIGCRGDLAFHIRRSATLQRTDHRQARGNGAPHIRVVPKGALPQRRNIVITTDTGHSAPGIETAASLQQALAMTADAPETMIIGGGMVYSEAMPVASRIYLTEVDASLDEADTFFPEIDRNQWTATSQSDTFTDEPTGLSSIGLSTCTDGDSSGTHSGLWSRRHHPSRRP